MFPQPPKDHRSPTLHRDKALKAFEPPNPIFAQDILTKERSKKTRSTQGPEGTSHRFKNKNMMWRLGIFDVTKTPHTMISIYVYKHLPFSSARNSYVYKQKGKYIHVSLNIHYLLRCGSWGIYFWGSPNTFSVSVFGCLGRPLPSFSGPVFPNRPIFKVKRLLLEHLKQWRQSPPWRHHSKLLKKNTAQTNIIMGYSLIFVSSKTLKVVRYL